MPIPRMVRRWNKAGLNKVTRRVAPWMPGLGVVVHRAALRERVPDAGQRLRRPRRLRPGSDLRPGHRLGQERPGAGGCELRTRGRTIRMTAPRLYRDETRHGIRPVERQVLRAIHVADFLSLKTAPAATQAAGES